MNYKSSMRKEGFTISEMIFTLIIISLCTTIMIRSIQVLPHNKEINQYLSDDTSLWQIRRLLAQSEEIVLDSNQLTFYYRNKECSLIIKNNKIIHRIGNEIMMMGIEKAEFRKEKSGVWLIWNRNNETFKAILCP